ncbi:hypothetical protein, partial [Streptomyces ipomoeae]|uniref:hypothetical protein n=2 Tax=Streptomyces ipomoeae TaxID=103232 RepID=UPI0029A06019
TGGWEAASGYWAAVAGREASAYGAAAGEGASAYGDTGREGASVYGAAVGWWAVDATEVPWAGVTDADGGTAELADAACVGAAVEAGALCAWGAPGV